MKSSQHPADMLHQPADPWRSLFSPQELSDGLEFFNSHSSVYRESWYSGCTFTFRRTSPSVEVTIGSVPEYIGQSWNLRHITCNVCRTPSCFHRAAALYAYEARFGKITLWEERGQYERRKMREAFQAVIDKRAAEDAEIGLNSIPVDPDIFHHKSSDGVLVFDLPGVLSRFTTTPAAVARLNEARKSVINYRRSIELLSTREGEQMIQFSVMFAGPAEVEAVAGMLLPQQLIIASNREYRESDRYYTECDQPVVSALDRHEAPLDAYELAVIGMLWDKADKAGMENITDAGALKFFSSIRAMQEKSAQKEVRAIPVPEKKAVVTLLPRIVMTDGVPVLSYKIGVSGGRLYVLKDCFSLISAVTREQEYVLGKRESLNFSTQTFTPESEKLFDFIQRNKVDSYANVYQCPLKGARLDNFYDMYLGGRCELLDKTNDIRDELVTVGHADIHFKLTSSRLSDARGAFIGIAVSGFVPVLVSGAANKYTLSRTSLSRISKSELTVLSPFLEVSDSAGYFRFQVGLEKLQEFYYRVLPPLLNYSFVEFDDAAGEEASGYLPPEPQFNFYLDLENSMLSLRATVQYDTLSYDLAGGLDYASGDYHDTDQEKRVLHAIEKWFPTADATSHTFFRKVSDDELYDFLTSGLSSLEFYGQVHGTSAFQSRHVLPQPRVQVGISVDGGGILNISVTSKELSSSELLDLYNSYRQKKRFHKIRSGDFIDLTQSSQFQDLDELLQSTDMDTMEAIRGKVHLPIFRALYLDKMLEKHDQIASTRDRTYRSLIRNFATVRDAEFEVPACLENVLRPYQTFGYKWLRTLQSSGFGGILADEMGLGKTVQMISVFQSTRDAAAAESRKALPSLVVCPASLVYNWLDEVERFAPDLKVKVAAGNLSSRKKILDAYLDTDVLITSYDLLKRDIVLYEDRRFSNCVLDEAQFIKNHRAAAAKSVKLIQAQHRYALTGTPIENRLSELWSIFDFLMPGFLYSQAEFERRFETPITKHKDEEATEKLKSMTAPFILRRKKEDVLKDLPAKLEEVRYARLEGEQQKIYDAQVVRMKEMLRGGELAGEEKIKIFAELTRIRQICCDPSLLFEDYAGESAKREACLDLIRSAIEGGHRMLVFSQFVSMLSLLEKELEKEGIEYYKIIGATTKEKRISLVRAFNEGTVPVFLISLKAGGTGLNLTGADMVIHYDPWWNLAAQNQATDRAHRIGQTKQVTVFKLILKNTIEERIMALQDAKKDLAEAILEGRSESLLSLSAEELMSLLG